MALAVMTPYTAIFLALGTFVFSESNLINIF